MNVSLAPTRPPYVEFHRIAKDDPVRSVELGHRVTKDVDMAYIMQPGSKDQIEIRAQDWLASIKRKMLEQTPGAYPDDWVAAFHKKFEAWKEGHEAPLIGTSVKEWPILSPAQAENFIALHVMTIEDVAEMTEEAMGRFGMGCRDLREKAREWLSGKEIAQNAIKENEELKKQLAEMASRLAALETTEASKKRGRPPKAKEE